MAPTVHGSASNAASVTGTTATVVLPASIPAGSVGLAAFAYPVNTATVTTEPTGWTLIDTGVNGTVLQSRIYRKDLGPADSGQTVTLVWSASGRWNVVVVVAAAAAYGNASAANLDAAADTTLDIPEVTPAVDDCLLVHLGSGRGNTVTAAVTYDTPWTTEQSVATTMAAAFTMGYIGTKPLTGGAGTPHAAATATWSASSTDISWTVALAPAPVVVLPRPQVHPSAAVIRASTR